MKGIPLEASFRENKGSADSRRLRKTGFIPAVLYSEEKEPQHLIVPKAEFSKIMHSRSKEHSLVEITIDGKNTVLAVIKEIQHNPVTDLIIHADFQPVQLDKPFNFVLPLVFVGEPMGVKKGGVFNPQMHQLEITCVLKDAPEVIEIDISEVELGRSFQVKDIPASNFTVSLPPDTVIASVVKPRGVEEAKQSEEAKPAAEETKEKDKKEPEPKK
jgi:large subunit ribosomal protein L25